MGIASAFAFVAIPAGNLLLPLLLPWLPISFCLFRWFQAGGGGDYRGNSRFPARMTTKNKGNSKGKDKGRSGFPSGMANDPLSYVALIML
jgi:hypothetical protein